MKKYFIILFTGILLLSCESSDSASADSSDASTEKKEESRFNTDIVGEWLIYADDTFTEAAATIIFMKDGTIKGMGKKSGKEDAGTYQYDEKEGVLEVITIKPDGTKYREKADIDFIGEGEIRLSTFPPGGKEIVYYMKRVEE